jgi:dCMP deaminase
MCSSKDYINWNELFMGIASFSSQRSKDPVRKVGAVLINDELKIVGTGYNGMPPGIKDTDNVWGKDSDNPLFNKKYLVCHAESNAIANSTCKVNGCTIYVTHFPCNECSKLLSIHGIKKLVYANEYGNALKEISLRILLAANIDIVKYDERPSFKIDIFE